MIPVTMKCWLKSVGHFTPLVNVSFSWHNEALLADGARRETNIRGTLFDGFKLIIIERMLGYLQVGYNPFIVELGKRDDEKIEKRETDEQKELKKEEYDKEEEQHEGQCFIHEFD